MKAESANHKTPLNLRVRPTIKKGKKGNLLGLVPVPVCPSRGQTGQNRAVWFQGVDEGCIRKRCL